MFLYKRIFSTPNSDLFFIIRLPHSPLQGSAEITTLGGGSGKYRHEGRRK